MNLGKGWMRVHYTVLSTFYRLKKFQNNTLGEKNKRDEQNHVVTKKKKVTKFSLFVLWPLNCPFWLMVRHRNVSVQSLPVGHP